jgi:hypothetical protein
MLGAMMKFVAFVLEKRLLRALRKERKPAEAAEQPRAEEPIAVTTGYEEPPSRRARR